VRPVAIAAKPPAERAIELLGGPSAVARQLGSRGVRVSPWAVSKWRRRIPAERVLLIEQLTGGRITRHELRPDLYPAEVAA
jgi:DNA-binding transcriptional regulator YdaS (Cro superfamily)